MPLPIENTVTATFKITTPMFIGDANKHADSIRPASIKGALRFWWRALNWHTHLCNAKNDINAALKSLHKEEAVLFGAAAEESSESKTSLGGQGLFLLQVNQVKLAPQSEPFGKNINSSLRYLLGQGLVTRDPDARKYLIERTAIDKGEFGLQLLFKKTSIDQKKSILDALYALGLLGALGSRARHGLGSISLKKWECTFKSTYPLCEYEVPVSEEEYKNKICWLLKPYIKSPQANILDFPITAFSPNARIDFSCTANSTSGLLTTIGEKQLIYRSNGQSGGKGKPRSIWFSKHRQVDVSGEFMPDHDLFMIKRTKAETAPKRAIFGLPHNYFYSNGRNIEVNYQHNDENRKRSSPLLLHIHELNENAFIAVHCLMPSLFLPKNRLRITTNDTEPYDRDITPDWAVITKYLDVFKSKETIFPHQQKQIENENYNGK